MRGFVIDAAGGVRPALRPDPAAASGRGALYIGRTRTGAEIVLRGEAVPMPALVRAVHLLATWRPGRIALTQPADGGGRSVLFSGVWEFATYAETLAQREALSPAGDSGALAPRKLAARRIKARR